MQDDFPVMCMVVVRMCHDVFFFFFQAEDGIRDVAVTGVQTCALPISACPNASAMLFVAAKVSHLGLLPQGQPERDARVVNMVARMDAEGFGACSNHGECMAACPKEISIDFIARLNRDYWRAVAG